MGNRENAGDVHFLFFSECFLLYQRQKSSLKLYLFFLSAHTFHLDWSKILAFSKELWKKMLVSCLIDLKLAICVC